MDGIPESIIRRCSVRTYGRRPISSSILKNIRSLLSREHKGPYGNTVRFRIAELKNMSSRELSDYGTYGFIRGAEYYILGVVAKGNGCMEDFGYQTESIILYLTEMGLGTCWLGGTFKRSRMAEIMKLKENEMLPASIPFGFPAEKKRTLEKLIRFGAGSNKRKPWSELFFSSKGNKLKELKISSEYAVPLECVRLAPSASNKQPWRLAVDNKRGSVDFYLRPTKGYGMLEGSIGLQNADMGIAMYHFKYGAEKADIAGKWSFERSREVEYIEKEKGWIHRIKWIRKI